MKTKGNILIVDDNKSVLSALQLVLQKHFVYVHGMSSPNLIISAMQQERYDVVLLDMNFTASVQSGNEGIYWLKRIVEAHPQVSVVMITAFGDVELAVRALKEGATDFLLKPWDNDKLVGHILSALKLSRTKKQLQPQRKTSTPLTDKQLIGSSPAFMHTLKMVHKVAKTDANILITGENGTGKELIARELHRLSARRQQPLVSVDMGSVSESLFESELFGHVKGAFTDAREHRKGKFEEADKGSLFLDEIGNLSPAMQVKLLTALQNRQIVRVGSNEYIPIDIRLICATNCQLHQMVGKGRFREDLLFRINTIQIELPPLRQRQEDIEDLANFFLQKYCQKYDTTNIQLHPSAIDKMRHYSWPGNIRELQHSIEKAVILCEGDSLTADDFNLKANTEDHSLPSDKMPHYSTIEDMEKEMIRQALKNMDGKLSPTADALGISRQTLYNKLKKYDIEH